MTEREASTPHLLSFRAHFAFDILGNISHFVILSAAKNLTLPNMRAGFFVVPPLSSE